VSSWAEFLTWVESSALGQAIRDSGVWTYGLINLGHIYGIATLFGSILVLDLRLLGWRRSTSLASIASATMPIGVVGFVIAAASGMCLLATNGSEYIGNPFLPIKFAAITLGLCNVLVVTRLKAWQDKSLRALTRRETSTLALFGGLSLLCWLIAIGAGRMIGYW
jgi:hypothetical protein